MADYVLRKAPDETGIVSENLIDKLLLLLLFSQKLFNQRALDFIKAAF